MRAKDAERFGKSLKPKEFLKGYLKPKKISASMEADPRKALMGKKSDSEMAEGLKLLSKKMVESIATGDGGTMYPAKPGSIRIKPSSTWSSTTATIYGTGSVTSGGTYLGSAITSGWAGSFGSSLSYSPWPEECDLSSYHQDILMKAICDKIAAEGVRPITYTFPYLGTSSTLGGVVTGPSSIKITYDET